MAKTTIRMPDEFLDKISRLGRKTDEIVPRILQKGGEVVLDKVKANLSGVIGRGNKSRSRSTGELEDALGVSPAMIDKKGNTNVKVGFSEPRKDRKSNALIANVLEYGKHGQPARPFLKPAVSAAKNKCKAAMIKALEDEVGKV